MSLSIASTETAPVPQEFHLIVEKCDQVFGRRLMDLFTASQEDKKHFSGERLPLLLKGEAFTERWEDPDLGIVERTTYLGVADIRKDARRYILEFPDLAALERVAKNQMQRLAFDLNYAAGVATLDVDVISRPLVATYLVEQNILPAYDFDFSGYFLKANIDPHNVDIKVATGLGYYVPLNTK